MVRVGYMTELAGACASFYGETYPFGFTSWRRAGP